MPVEDVFSITGRGTVATGRVERGQLKMGEEVEIVGLMDAPRKTVVTGIEMFRKLLDYAEAGDNIGALLRGIQKTEICLLYTSYRSARSSNAARARVSARTAMA